jgi:hypothetical protein
MSRFLLPYLLPILYFDPGLGWARVVPRVAYPADARPLAEYTLLIRPLLLFWRCCRSWTSVSPSCGNMFPPRVTGCWLLEVARLCRLMLGRE